jgi:hypothetical protein
LTCTNGCSYWSADEENSPRIFLTHGCALPTELGGQVTVLQLGADIVAATLMKSLANRALTSIQRRRCSESMLYQPSQHPPHQLTLGRPPPPLQDYTPPASRPDPTTATLHQSSPGLPQWRHGQVTPSSGLSRSWLPAVARRLLHSSPPAGRSATAEGATAVAASDRRPCPDRARRARPAGEYGGTATRLPLGRTRPLGGWLEPGNQAKGGDTW